MVNGGSNSDQMAMQPGWEMTTRRPDARLRPAILDCTDYAEGIAGTLRRRELPTTRITLMIGLGEPLRVEDASGGRLTIHGSGFLAGIHDAPAFTTAIGPQRGMEARLTPLGAHRLLGLPMDALANHAVDLTTLLGADARLLIERLHEPATPAARLTLLEAAIGSRIAAGVPLSGEVSWAWSQLRRSHGAIAIATLAGELGWSQKRLIARFREAVGVPPKTAAQILRFERAVALAMATPGPVDWAAVAIQGGYCDQSHLVREFRRFAGRAPGQLLRDRLAADLGFAAT